jgi:hypothetical protein
VAVRAKLLPVFRDAMKDMGIEKFKIRIEDAIEKKLSDQQEAIVRNAVAKAKAESRGGLMGLFV